MNTRRTSPFGWLKNLGVVVGNDGDCVDDDGGTCVVNAVVDDVDDDGVDEDGVDEDGADDGVDGSGGDDSRAVGVVDVGDGGVCCCCWCCDCCCGCCCG